MSEEMEQRARQMGWLPQDEFRGNPDNWVEASKFVDMAETSLPHLKGTLKVMESKMKQQSDLLARQNEEVTGLRKDLGDLVDFYRGTEERAYAKAVKDLQAKQLKAKEAGDMPAFVEATESLDDLIKEHPAVTGKAKPASDGGNGDGTAKQLTPQEQYQKWMESEPTAFDDWRAENPWFDESWKMADAAKRIDQFLHDKYGLTKPRSERLKEVTKMIKEEFPDYFGNTARKKGSPVEGDTGARPAGDGSGKTYNDLPPDAKAQCDKWSGKDGKGTGTLGAKFTREEYVKSYKW